MNWDDIKLFLEVARSQRLSIAAKRLQLDSSTVSRRLHKLEQSLTVKLFDRTLDGHQLTDDGRKLLAAARSMELQANQALNTLKLQQQQNAGTVRVGATEAFGNFFIAPNLSPLLTQYPNIQLDLLLFSRHVKISRNEADIAIMVEKPNSSSMIVSPLCDYQLMLYAHPDYLAKTNIPVTLETLNQHQWVSYIDSLLFTEQLSYLNELPVSVHAQFRATSVIGQFTAIKQGIGLGILPCFLAAQEPKLQRLVPEIIIKRHFYLVAHPESKRLSQVETVWRYLKVLAEQHQDLLMGN
jgi:DNA-binding transcriptional LysR family regulator